MPDPISSKALTLADYARQSNDPTIMKITKCLLDGGSILDDLPLVTNASLKIRGGRMEGKDLPETAWGRINKAPVDIKTTSSTYEESACLVREKIQIDRRLLKAPDWVDDPWELQIAGAMAAHRYDTNEAFFHNDPSAPGGNPDAWIGLRTRIKDPAKYGVAANLDIDASSIDFTRDLTGEDANDFLELLEESLALLGADEGEKCVLYCNYVFKNRLARAIRKLGAGAGFSTDKDAFGRRVDMYGNVKVRNIGFKKNQTDLLLPNTLTATGEDSGTATKAYTEAYLVRYGDNYMKGWQTNPLKPEYLGRSTEYGTYENVLIDWACGLCYANTRSFVRIKGIKLFA